MLAELLGVGADDLISLRTFFALDDIELYRVAFLKGLVSIRLDGAVVNKDVSATIAAEKAVTLGVVKPLHCACVLRHGIFTSCWFLSFRKVEIRQEHVCFLDNKGFLLAARPSFEQDVSELSSVCCCATYVEMSGGGGSGVRRSEIFLRFDTVAKIFMSFDGL